MNSDRQNQEPRIFPLIALALITLNVAVGRADSGGNTTDATHAPTSPAAAAAKRVVVWDGEQETRGLGWASPKPCTLEPQTVEAHSGKTALEFKFKGSGDVWLGAGWN